jgi:hypothetical protein
LGAEVGGRREWRLCSFRLMIEMLRSESLLDGLSVRGEFWGFDFGLESARRWVFLGYILRSIPSYLHTFIPSYLHTLIHGRPTDSITISSSPIPHGFLGVCHGHHSCRQINTIPYLTVSSKQSGYTYPYPSHPIHPLQASQRRLKK